MTFRATESFLNLHGEKRALKRTFLTRTFIRVFKTNRVKIQFLLAFDILSAVSSPANLLHEGFVFRNARSSDINFKLACTGNEIKVFLT